MNDLAAIAERVLRHQMRDDMRRALALTLPTETEEDAVRFCRTLAALEPLELFENPCPPS